MELRINWGYITYTVGNADDIDLGEVTKEVAESQSLKAIRDIARQVVSSDKLMIDYMVSQMRKVDKARWFNSPSNRASPHAEPSQLSRAWLWNKAGWRNWRNPIDSLEDPSRRVNIRSTHVIQKQQVDYLQQPNVEGDRRFDTYYVVPACQVSAFYRISYPKGEVAE